MTQSLKKTKRLRPHAKGRVADAAELERVQALIGPGPYKRDLLIEYLHCIQDTEGHLPAALLVALAELMRLGSAEVYEVASFYHHFDVVKEHEQAPAEITVRVCESVGCALAGSEALIKELQQRFGDEVRIQPVPCVGRCDSAPVAVVGQNPIDHADSGQVEEAVTNKAVMAATPEAIDYQQYHQDGGYQLLKNLHDHNAEEACEQVIATLEDAGLRGLGGAGFPAGRKWRIVRGFTGPRMMAVNIDEGEPGTFKDRYYLERDPHRFLEGTLVAARVVGVEAVYIYLRDEYAGCRQLLQESIAELQAEPPCPLPAIYLRRGAGAYICGEESAMIESIEGKRGMPRLRPPYIAERGLFGLPTLEHNMETVYWVREIVEKGADWFSSHGRHERKGLRSFSVSGRVNNPGVHLAPAGITLQELVDEYCGGMLPGHSLKAYFPGGASGGILPASMADIPLDFDTLNQYGCFIGSAAVIVLSDQDSVREAAQNAMAFFAHESCGQCTPCRVGTEKAAQLMQAADWDAELLNDLALVMEDASICGLGQAAPNPLRCAMKYFPEEFA